MSFFSWMFAMLGGVIATATALTGLGDPEATGAMIHAAVLVLLGIWAQLHHQNNR